MEHLQAHNQNFFSTGEVPLNWGILINISLKTKKGPTGKNFGLYSSRHPKSIFTSNFCNFVAKDVFALNNLIYVKVIEDITRLGFQSTLLTKDLIYTIVNRRYLQEIPRTNGFDISRCVSVKCFWCFKSYTEGFRRF